MLFNKLISTFRTSGETPQICRVYADPGQTEYPAFCVGITAGVRDIFTLIIKVDGHIHGLKIDSSQARLLLSKPWDDKDFNFLIEKW